MIKRVLIANRGEIACRVIACCRQLGIESVAVYSDADRNARHVREADLACHIGPAPSRESYLNAGAIIEAALAVHADAIHPGYGFLSESTELVGLCEQHGIAFVGPTQDSIARMGSKIESKFIAKELGIPTVPGYAGADQDPARLEKEAIDIGLPVLIKASAGGGGKGMRIVRDVAELSAALKQVKQEALNAFGDDSVLLERYIERPRHIEVQVLADSHGNAIHLYDRECSIQRNYQKVIEEAPVSHLDQAIRETLYRHAVGLAKHLAYRGAGTVEFILDADTSEAWFLEMNTRLQVEHPVTEMITGLDLVEWQLRIASGEKLAFSQDQIHCNGFAIEARVNAENPAEDYRPEIGQIQLYREPQAQCLRIDSGVLAGSEISPHYDSMIAKLIAHGSTRGQATQRLLQGINDFAIGPVQTNQDFLASLLTRPAFHQVLTTNYINEAFPSGWQPWGELLHIAIATSAWACQRETRHDSQMAESPWQVMGNWRLTTASGNPATSKLWLKDGSLVREVLLRGSCGRYEVQVDDDSVSLQLNTNGDGSWQVEYQGNRRRLDIHFDGDTVSLSSPRRNSSYRFVSLEECHLGDAAAGAGGNTIRAALPGLITDLLVAEGDIVEEGQPVITLEAMKMIHTLTAPCSGQVTAVLTHAGDNVADGKVLVEIYPSE